MPHYDDHDGDTYFYATALSDEDRKKGKAVGSVVSFRYLGERDGKHVLASLTESGRAIAENECSNPCKIIKQSYRGVIERIPYNPSSVIGAAFEDALNGSLRVGKGSSGATENAPAIIPAAFVGEWNEDLQACGTGNNDSRLRIEPRRVRFYESDGDVRRVSVINQRAVNVAASFSGEGQTWTSEVQFVLSRSGDDLSSGDITRHRCPA